MNIIMGHGREGDENDWRRIAAGAAVHNRFNPKFEIFSSGITRVYLYPSVGKLNTEYYLSILIKFFSVFQ